MENNTDNTNQTYQSPYESSSSSTNSSFSSYAPPKQQSYRNVVCSPKSKGVALILCIFLGPLGIHRFYVGKVGSGILYLFTCGLFCIGWIVDIFLILFGSFKDSNGLPIK